jgi:hypothetical protein
MVRPGRVGGAGGHNPAALGDLHDRLPGVWHAEVADLDGRGIRVGVVSKAALTDVEQVPAFPVRPVMRS